MKLRLIPAGEFMMGAPESLSPGQPQHRVRITTPFYVGVTEVTQDQWEAVMGTHPWRGEKYVMEGADYPAVHVRWEDAKGFCRRLSERENVMYRLPTEAEWEYACRGGTTTNYSFGNDISKLSDYAWFQENTRQVGEKYPHKVGRKRPNAFGLYDVHGNVWELCEWYDGNDHDNDGRRSISDSRGVKRGGCWFYWGSLCRSSFRCLGSTTRGNHSLGFRVVREVVDASDEGSMEKSEVD
ncbi:MAG: formylglycine-generating enzyme family protein [Planctomycetota bacterium]